MDHAGNPGSSLHLKSVVTSAASLLPCKLGLPRWDTPGHGAETTQSRLCRSGGWKSETEVRQSWYLEGAGIPVRGRQPLSVSSHGGKGEGALWGH